MKNALAVVLVGLVGILLAIGVTNQFGHAQLMSPSARAVIPPFAVERDNIAAASVNLAFGFTSRIVAIEAPSGNADRIAVDWTGGTAVCPAVNTAGNKRLAPGTAMIIDDLNLTSISVIACSGTLGVFVDAWQ